MVVTVAIVGPSGRDPCNAYTHGTFRAMMDMAAKTIDGKVGLPRRDVVLVSGGSAWSDHVAVSLYLDAVQSMSPFAGLRLYLPCAIDVKSNAFTPLDRCGRILNKLHAQFGRTCGMNTVGEIVMALRTGATATVSHGFLACDVRILESHFLLTFVAKGTQVRVGKTDRLFRSYRGKQLILSIPTGVDPAPRQRPIVAYFRRGGGDPPPPPNCVNSLAGLARITSKRSKGRPAGHITCGQSPTALTC